jgi:peptidoglycan/xylan/chitin deacetylase (PgdA/CDA1 family)
VSAPHVLTLAYHLLSESWPPPLGISESTLRSHLGLLQQRGYVGLTFGEAERRRRLGELPDRTVVITFDDGYASTLRAREILADYGYRGTVFVATDFVDSGEPFSWPGLELPSGSPSLSQLASLTWPECRALLESGWEIGSHTTEHGRLTDLEDEILRDHLERSRARIVEELGSCDTVAYPYGQADRRVAKAAAEAGYVAGCTCSARHDVDEPLRRPRINLSGSDTGVRLRVQLSPLTERVRRTELIRLAWILRRGRSWTPRDE